MPLYQMTQPAVEPVTLNEAKAHLRITTYDQDALISSLITAARRLCEQHTRRCFITQTIKETFERFPFMGFAADRLLPISSFQPQTAGVMKPIAVSQQYGGIYLMRAPVQSITSITYYDANNNLTTMSASAYYAQLDPQGAVIVPGYNTWWPAARLFPESVSITYVAGYGSTGDAVPATIRQAILLLVGQWYENRENANVAAQFNQMPMAVDALLATERAWEFK